MRAPLSTHICHSERPSPCFRAIFGIWSAPPPAFKLYMVLKACPPAFNPYLALDQLGLEGHAAGLDHAAGHAQPAQLLVHDPLQHLGELSARSPRDEDGRVVGAVPKLGASFFFLTLSSLLYSLGRWRGVPPLSARAHCFS